MFKCQPLLEELEGCRLCLKPSSFAKDADDGAYVIPHSRQAIASSRNTSTEKLHGKKAGLSQDTTSSGRTLQSMSIHLIPCHFSVEIMLVCCMISI